MPILQWGIGNESSFDRVGWRLGSRLVRKAIVALLAVGVIYFLILTALVHIQGNRDEARHADAIIVLGAAQYQGVPSPVLRARLDHAIQLYQEGYAPLLITTGGKLEGDLYTEAETSQVYAIRHGVPATSIEFENHGRTTLQSLEGVRAIMAARGIQKAIIVSDTFHILRAKRMARDLGIQAYGSPTRTSPILRHPWSEAFYTLRETASYTHYLIRGI